jgi:hypothetical protein
VCTYMDYGLLSSPWWRCRVPCVRLVACCEDSLWECSSIQGSTGAPSCAAMAGAIAVLCCPFMFAFERMHCRRCCTLLAESTVTIDF